MFQNFNYAEGLREREKERNELGRFPIEWPKYAAHSKPKRSV